MIHTLRLYRWDRARQHCSPLAAERATINHGQNARNDEPTWPFSGEMCLNYHKCKWKSINHPAGATMRVSSAFRLCPRVTTSLGVLRAPQAVFGTELIW